MSILFDGFKNILKGLGGVKDARQSRQYHQGMIVTQQTADDLYSYNWLASKVVDIPIDDATREWRNLLISDPEQKKEVEEIFKEFDVKGKFNRASKWARVFGGAVIIMVVDGDQSEPIDIENIKEGSLQNLLVLDRYNITSGPVDQDITSKNFGQPEFYSIVRKGQQIHHTRVIKFIGQQPTIYQAEQNNFWGLSLFTKLWEPIGDSQETSNSIATLIYESNIDVYKIKGFNELVAANDELAVKRLKIIHEMKSIVNGIALDGEDDYEKKSNSFANLHEIDDRFIQKVAGAAEIPVTRLLGVSPAGQNATGESDMRNYYDSVSSIQENYFRPKLDIIDQVILGSAGHTEEFLYVFNPLQQLTESQQAEVDLKNAQRDQVYLDNGIVEESDIRLQLAANGTYVSLDQARIDEFIQSEEFNGE